MSRSIADYLVQENYYEDEYKRNFSDYFSSDSESSCSSIEDVNDFKQKQKRLARVELFYNEFVAVCRSWGFLQNATLYDFCKLIGEAGLLDPIPST